MGRLDHRYHVHPRTSLLWIHPTCHFFKINLCGPIQQHDPKWLRVVPAGNPGSGHWYQISGSSPPQSQSAPFGVTIDVPSCAIAGISLRARQWISTFEGINMDKWHPLPGSSSTCVFIPYRPYVDTWCTHDILMWNHRLMKLSTAVGGGAWASSAASSAASWDSCTSWDNH